MLKKGQISFDFLLAVLGFIALIWVLQTVLTDVQLNEEETSIRIQQKNIGLSLQEIVSSSRGLDGETFSVKFNVPKIVTSQGEIDCAIVFENNAITISSGEIVERIPFVKPNINIPNINCGETLEVTNL